ncbi:putative holin-like toxin [Paenibacillus alkaliterrae]|nr:putative holin-like toxin [Paenibacillus alkaliterrae]
MKVEAVITIMILFGSFILALLTYISNNYKKK